MSCWLVGLRYRAIGFIQPVTIAHDILPGLLPLAFVLCLSAAPVRAQDQPASAAAQAVTARVSKNVDSDNQETVNKEPAKTATEKKATEKKATEKKDTEKEVSAEKEAPVDKEALYKKFAESMTGVKLVGQFTVRGKENDKPARDEYTILSATKMENGDYWLIKARIQYGKNDLTIPMPLQVKWAGKTPVITLDQVSIPGLGTFSSRVVIDGTMYAGTWTHDKVGGHMFGTIEKLPQE
jgi:hypothetical protein